MNKERLNSMGNRIKEVSAITVFPNRGADDYTYMALAITDLDHHILIWSPHVNNVDCSITSESESLYDTTLQDLMIRRRVEFGGLVYTGKQLKEDVYFKIFDLDHSYKQKISKADIEKVFGCEVND